MSVIDRDLGYGEVLDAMGEIHGLDDVLVGIDAVEHPDQAVYGAVHEFGSTEHREAAFLRSTTDRSEDDLSNAIGEGLARAIDGRGSARAGVQTAGEQLRDNVRRKISEAGLVDSGRLRDAIEVHRDR